MNTKIEYNLMLMSDEIIILKWEFNTKEQALAIYNEKKNSKVYKRLDWKLEKIETIITDIELD